MVSMNGFQSYFSLACAPHIVCKLTVINVSIKLGEIADFVFVNLNKVNFDHLGIEEMGEFN